MKKILFYERRKEGDRRVALNSCVDPQHDRRVNKDRRKED
jgi:hypothetical protein